MPDDAAPPDLANLAKDWEDLHAYPPPILYHYTAAAGVMGILGSQRLWATNARFLNDPSEVRYALKLVAETLQEEEKAYSKTRGAEATLTLPDAMIFGRDKIPRIETWAKDLLQVFQDQREVYVACFCEEGDLLSQWRGYAASGGGYAIGIAVDAWPRGNTGGDARATILRRVIYEPNSQRQMVRNWVRGMFDSDLAWRQARRDHIKRTFAEAQGRGDKTPPETRTTPVATNIYKAFPPAQAEARERYKAIEIKVTRFLAECLISFKDPAYAEEREWRAIQLGFDAPPVKFRTRGGSIIPFVELDLTAADGSARGRLPIRSITYGPTLEPGVTDRSLKMLCASAGYADPEVAVRQSSIPFRGSV